MIKSFANFISEDFNSHGAQQFLIPVSTVLKGGGPKGASSAQTIMMFYEHVAGSSFNLTRYAKSFLASDVSAIMKAPSNDYRVLIYHTPEGSHIFVWYASIQHTQMTKSLDANKGMKKYPSNIKYQYLYNESQMFMEGDLIGPAWCFPFIIWQGSIVSNLMPEALTVLNKAKDVKSTFQLSNAQWDAILKKQEFRL
jgi:hypothetical protein